MQKHSMWLQKHISLDTLNTLGVKAQARYYTRIDDVQQLQQLLWSRSLKPLPRLILGGGSNVLFIKDFEGIVIHMAIKGIATIREDKDHVWIQAGAGVSWHQLVRHCVAHNYAGIENLSFIPGTVGAAPVQNIGAYGVELSETFEALEAMEIDSCRNHIFDATACGFGYRESIFKNKLKGQYIILNVTLKLHKNPIFRVSYGDIQRTLETMNIKQLSVKAISDAVTHLRQRKLPNPAHLGNVGSFFKNPVITQVQFNQLKLIYPQIPGYQQPQDQIKVPAAWLIEQCGWKGQKIGAIGVHAQHALVLVNYGGGTGKDIYQLAQDIQQSVIEKFGITLIPEVQVIG